MKKLWKIVILSVLVTTMLSGCIVWPWWDEDWHGGYGHHRGHGGEYGERRRY